MSQFYDNASLVVVPSGYKAGTVYAQKPLTTDGQLAFTRTGDTATRVNSAGLIEKVRTNLLTYSQDFSNAAWNKLNVTLTSGQTDPNGGATASTVDPTNTTSAYVRQSISITSGVKYTWSVYIKGSTTGQSIALYTDGASNIYEVKSLTTSWQRFTGVATAASSGSSGFYVLCGSGYSGLTDLPFDIAFAQVEASDIATAYIPTTTAAVSVGPTANTARLDYLGSTCPRLILEGQRTNLVTFSEQLNNAAWTKDRVTVTANVTTAPDGTVSAEKVVDTLQGNNAYRIYNGATLSAISYSASFYVKAAEYSWVYIRIGNSLRVWFNVTTGVVGGADSGMAGRIENAGNGWYRCTAIITTATAGGGFALLGLTNANNVETYTPTTGGQGVFVWGAQLEAGAYATSYIPTLAASATRGADACSKTGISSLIGQTEGTLFADFVVNGIGSIPANILNSEKNLTAAFFMALKTNGNIVASLYVSGAETARVEAGTVNVRQRAKVAYAYKSGSSALYINGTQVATSTAAYTLPTTLDDLFINDPVNYFAGQENVSYNQVLLFKTRLTNAELAELTTL